MKKISVLFINNSMMSGGAEKALLSLLSVIDSNKYDVDLLLLNKTGVFLSYLPAHVRVIDMPKWELKSNIKSGQYYLNAYKYLYVLFIQFIRATIFKFRLFKKIKNQIRWGFTKKILPALENEYDIAIAFLEITSLYYLVDKVKAKRKISFIHTDYQKAGLNHKFDQKYYEQVDRIIAISESVYHSFCLEFPEYSSKVNIINNIIDPEQCIHLSNESVEDFSNDSINILTVGRLSKEKGYDIAIDALELLIKSGYRIKWYALGNGPEMDVLKAKLNQLSIEEYFIFLGEKANPYPYFRKCDLYVQPSRYEGRSIAIEEALIFKKIVVTTNNPGAREQIIHSKTGIICEASGRDIFENIARIIDNKQLREEILKNLNNREINGSVGEINKLYEVIDQLVIART